MRPAWYAGAGRIVRFVDDDEMAAFDPSLLTFFNVNTPADLDLATRLRANRSVQ